MLIRGRAWDAFVDSPIFSSDLLVTLVTTLSTREAIGGSLSKEDISVGVLELNNRLMHLIDS
jgi:hypothetical protein